MTNVSATTNASATTNPKHIFTVAELFKEIPLAFFSFLFFKLMKFVFGNLYNFQLQRSSQKFIWQPLSTETLESSFTLPFWMTFGPRLNTHAIIAPVGPLQVQHSVDIDVELAENSAKSWTIAIYQFPSYKTITRISASDSNLELAEKWKKITLSPGNYMLGLRYYDWEAAAIFPSVKVDGINVIQSQKIPSNINKFYGDLITKKNWFYYCLNYYVFTILALKRWLPESFVKKQFLPVGDSSLVYYYGLIRNHQSIKFTLDSKLFETYNVYLSLYDRASFVVDFYQIKDSEHKTVASKSDGFYLIRIRHKPGTKESKIFVKQWVNIKVVIT